MTAPSGAPFWNLSRVAQALSGRTSGALPNGDRSIRAISTDTRAISPGDLFVALRGDRFDAHDYVQQAVAAGAAALVVQRPPALRSLGVPVYVVDDTLVALGDLAHFWRRKWGRTVVGIAGSNGKTSTKELVRAALGAVYCVHATTGNLNNRIGVPLTLLAIPADAEIAVVEMGTSVPGEVATLRKITAPDVSVVTSVAEEHLEGLGDIEGVLREEASAFDGVPLGVAPASQPEIAATARKRAARVITAGLSDADLAPDNWRIDPDGLGVLELGGVAVRPPLRGLHNLRNTMLALATARACGVSLDDSARGIGAMPQPKMRVAWEEFGTLTVVNDAYNSNPGSARAAITMLSDMGPARQRVLVLGTMRELGARSNECHDDVARAAVESGADLVAGIGDFAAALQRVAPHRDNVLAADDVEQLWQMLQPRLAPDAVIFLKASRGVALERILPHITNWTASAC